MTVRPGSTYAYLAFNLQDPVQRLRDLLDVVKGDVRLSSLRWQGIVDPDHYHEVFLSTSVPPKGWNRGFYADPEVDRWILDARRLLDRQRRKALTRELQVRAVRDLPTISLYTTMSIAVHDSRLTGVEA